MLRNSTKLVDSVAVELIIFVDGVLKTHNWWIDLDYELSYVWQGTPKGEMEGWGEVYYPYPILSVHEYWILYKQICLYRILFIRCFHFFDQSSLYSSIQL